MAVALDGSDSYGEIILSDSGPAGEKRRGAFGFCPAFIRALLILGQKVRFVAICAPAPDDTPSLQNGWGRPTPDFRSSAAFHVAFGRKVVYNK